jgi:hypothetical protein
MARWTIEAVGVTGSDMESCLLLATTKASCIQPLYLFRAPEGMTTLMIFPKMVLLFNISKTDSNREIIDVRKIWGMHQNYLQKANFQAYYRPSKQNKKKSKSSDSSFCNARASDRLNDWICFYYFGCCSKYFYDDNTLA